MAGPVKRKDVQCQLGGSRNVMDTAHVTLELACVNANMAIMAKIALTNGVLNTLAVCVISKVSASPVIRSK